MKKSFGLLSVAALALAGFLQFVSSPAEAQVGALVGGNGQTIFNYLQMPAGTLMLGQGAGMNPVAGVMSGDCTVNGSLAITCTKTNGTLFGTAATVNVGTSGSALGLLSANNTYSGTLNTFTGHMAVGNAAPTVSSCGTGSPAIVGNDSAGEVTLGTSAAGCTITFASAYTAAPICTVTWQGTPLASQSYVISNTAITLTQTPTSANKVDYHCNAQNGG